jgi:hypothetical protein
MQGVLPIKTAILHELHLPLDVPPILGGCIIAPTTLAALQGNLLNISFLFARHRR